MQLAQVRSTDVRSAELKPTHYSLLTLEALASLLARTPAGLRATIHSNTEFGGALRGARVKLGRRVYFRRDLIDRLIVESTGL